MRRGEECKRPLHQCMSSGQLYQNHPRPAHFMPLMGMSKGKSAKGMSKGKTKAKKHGRQRAVLSSESSDLTDTEGSMSTCTHKIGCP